MSGVSDHKNYLSFLSEVKSKILHTRVEASRVVSRQLIQFYWWLGGEIVQRQEVHGWGKSVVERLAQDLQKLFPNLRGFSIRNLWQTRQFFLVYKNHPKLQQLAAEIPWTHNMLILNKIQNMSEREFYLRRAIQLRWSRKALRLQIESDLYHRQHLNKQHNFEKALPKDLATQANESLKSVYMLDMLGLNGVVSEAQLENKIVEKVKHVMLELGYGFSFIGNQYSICAKAKQQFFCKF